MGHRIFILPPNERYIVIGVILLIAVIIRASQFLAARGQDRTPLGSPRNYGLTGGAICPRCQRPFAFNFFAINMGIGTKLVRCPYCGKWSISQCRSNEELRAAEIAEASAASLSNVHSKTEEEKMKDRLDNSRFTDK